MILKIQDVAYEKIGSLHFIGTGLIIVCKNNMGRGSKNFRFSSLIERIYNLKSNNCSNSARKAIFGIMFGLSNLKSWSLFPRERLFKVLEMFQFHNFFCCKANDDEPLGSTENAVVCVSYGQAFCNW